MLRRLLFSIVALMSFTQWAQAQVQHEAPRQLLDSTLRRLDNAIAGRRVLRVQTNYGAFDVADPRITATSVEYSRLLSDRSFLPDSVLIPMPMPMRWVYAVQVPHHNPAKWALIAGLGTSVVGLLIGAFDKLDEDLTCTFFCRRPGFSPVEGAAIFGGIGATIGLLTGFFVSDWKTIYRAF